MKKGRLLLIFAVVALVVVLALPALPAVTSHGDLTGSAAGVVHADAVTPTPTPAGSYGQCQGGASCGG
ncbi:MAG: hypothetical protein NT169_05535 [Chloroflexi bacterium]|nr:hypothetical protein [Chloroflexota bacterium]